VPRAGLEPATDLWDGKTLRGRFGADRACSRHAGTPWTCARHGAHGLPRPTRSPPREPLAPPTARGGPAAQATTAAAAAGPALLGARPSAQHAVAPPSRAGAPGYRRAVAPPGVAPLLALAVADAAGPPPPFGGDPGVDRHHVARERAVGHRAHPRGAAQARDRGQQPLHPPLPVARSGTAAEPDLAHLLGQPRPPALGRGSLHGANADVSHPVRCQR
jgi:hypothetical protein